MPPETCIIHYLLLHQTLNLVYMPQAKQVHMEEEKLPPIFK